MSARMMALTGRRPSSHRRYAGSHLLYATVIGAAAGAATALLVGWANAALVSWIAAATAFLTVTWCAIWQLDADETARIALREDPSRPVSDLILLTVAVVALLTVALVIIHADRSGPVRTGLGVGCVVASWTVLHTVFTLRYARLYYADSPGGLGFNQDAAPSFRDFAYVAFTIGMAFQVSDTAVKQPSIRLTVLRHALMSFVFDTVIIAVTVNVVAGL
jgi:uncharacterized membrane protein